MSRPVEITYHARIVRWWLAGCFGLIVLLGGLAAIAAIASGGIAGVGRGFGIFGVMLFAIVATRRHLVVDRERGELRLTAGLLRRGEPEPQHPLEGVTGVEVEEKEGRARLVLVYGAHRRPVTQDFFYGVAHHHEVAEKLRRALA